MDGQLANVDDDNQTNKVSYHTSKKMIYYHTVRTCKSPMSAPPKQHSLYAGKSLIVHNNASIMLINEIIQNTAKNIN